MKPLFFLAIFTLTSFVFALEDTTSNRQEQARRYLEANPPKAMAQSLADQAAAMLPDLERQPYQDMLTKYLDLSVINQAMQTALVKAFTADELEVLANFYSNPHAKTAMLKMDNYMSDVLPVLQAEMLKAQQKAFNVPNHTQTKDQSPSLVKFP
ncbi:MAG TPA: DUF2059 domain-containing protein [Thiolinea sp.]|nr:DUF2059 domain-containing protein [Thiolinea sp.]